MGSHHVERWVLGSKLSAEGDHLIDRRLLGGRENPLEKHHSRSNITFLNESISAILFL